MTKQELTTELKKLISEAHESFLMSRNNANDGYMLYINWEWPDGTRHEKVYKHGELSAERDSRNREYVKRK